MRKLLYVSLTIMLLVMTSSCGPKDEKQKEITLTYASWNLGDALSNERQLIEAFEDNYPNITIEIVERPNEQVVTEATWDMFLHDLADDELLPDVFMMNDINHLADHDLLYDLSQLALSDKEFKKVSQDITAAGMIDDQLLALPGAAHYSGFLINQDLFETEMAPEFGIEWSTFMERIEEIANHEPGGSGIVGFEGVKDIMNWYPVHINPELGWLTYNGESFYLNDPAFKEAIEVQQDLIKSSNYVLEALSSEQSAEFFGTGDLWMLGRQAVKFADTQTLSQLLNCQDRGNMSDFDVAFIGTPVVNETQKIPVKVDWMGLSHVTENPEAAYLFAEWMGLGKEGYVTRLSLATDEEPLTIAPLQIDTMMQDAFFYQFGDVPGYQEVINHGEYVVESMPNLDATSVDDVPVSNIQFYDMLDKLMTGDKSTSQLSEFNRVVNEMLAEIDSPE